MQATVSKVVQSVLTEDVLTVPQARTELQELTGIRPDKSTMTRWILKGSQGVRLEAVKLGRNWITSRQALTRFIVARTTECVR